MVERLVGCWNPSSEYNVLSILHFSVLASYMVWHVVRITIPYLSSEFQRVRQTANALLDGVSTMPDRWLTCVSNTESSLSLATGAMYVEKYFSQDDKSQVRITEKS